jgi:hypothetical protein
LKIKIVLMAVLLMLPGAGANVLSAQEPPRNEINFSMGWVIGRDIGIIKSYGYFIIPQIVEFEIGLDIIPKEYPLMGNLTLHLPLKKIVPFLTAGAGFSFSGTHTKSLGVGLKYRLSERTGLLLEYRRFWNTNSSLEYRDLTSEEERTPAFIAAGITYLF